MKILICDDNLQELESINSQVTGISQHLHIETEILLSTSGSEVIDILCIQKESFDILLLDIEMPKISGIYVAQKIREYNINILLIFISSHEQYVFKSIEYRPFRYIRKNHLEQELPQAINAATSVIALQNTKTILIKTDLEDVKITVSDIMYFEKEDRKLTLHLSDGTTYSMWRTIKEMLDEINSENFVQIHSGCVVNTEYISKFSSFDITLDNGERLIASRRKIKDVKSALLKYWGRRI